MSIRRSVSAWTVVVLTTAVAGAVLVGCGEDDTAGNDTTTSSTQASETTDPPAGEPDPADQVQVEVYFARDAKVAVDGATAAAPATARGALEALLAGPDSDAAEAGMVSEVPEATELLDVSIDEGAAVVDLSSAFVTGGDEASLHLRVAQVVFTLTQFDTVDSVSFRIDGVDADASTGVPAGAVDRSQFEDVTPLVLVTSPLPGEQVSSPVTVSGISNTFEANVLYEVVAQDGTVLTDGFTTATAGTGTWGEFELAASFDAPAGASVTVVAYQEDMESGGRQDVYEVPVQVAG